MRQRILYIEDDAAQLALVQAFLEQALPDVLVDVCTTEAGAEAFLNTSCYDLIICDYCLPGAATGAMIAERVLARDPCQPFYLMSEYIGENVKAEAARVGLEMHGKFSTVKPEDFLARVTELLKKRPCVTAAIGGIGDDRHGTLDDANSSNGRDQPAHSVESARFAGNHRQFDRGHQVRCLKPIRLTSPHVAAIRMTLGRT